MKIARLDEKLELTKELGLKQLHSSYKAIEELTHLKFQIVSIEEIKKKLWWGCVKSNLSKLALKGFLLGFAIMPLYIFDFIIVINYLNATDSIALSILCGFVMFALLHFPAGLAIALASIEINTKELSKWNEDVPYGALLAVKEAQQEEVHNFTVWYPSIKKADPIITGETMNGNLVEIFHWDPQKIYDK